MKPKVYGTKEAVKVGLSKLIRDAEESGMVLLQRNNVNTAIILPVSIAGLNAFRKMFSETMTNDAQKLRENPQLAAVANMVMGLLQSLPEGPGNAGEQPGSAGQGGVTRRRRKVSK